MKLSPKSANNLVNTFVTHKILVETTGYQRNRIFVFNEYLQLFNEIGQEKANIPN